MSDPRDPTDPGADPSPEPEGAADPERAERPDPAAAEAAADAPPEPEPEPAGGEPPAEPAAAAPPELAAAEAPAEPSAGAPEPEPEPEPQAPTAEPAGGPAGDPVAPPGPERRSPARRLVAILAVPLLALGLLFLAPRQVDLLVDNGLPVPVEVSIDGVVVAPEVAAYTVARLEDLPAGDVELLARPLAGEGEPVRLEAAVEAGFFRDRPTWVWNVGQATEAYWVVSRTYGDVEPADAPAPEPHVPEGPVFRIPADLVATLDEELPDEAKVAEGTTGAVRRALWTARKLAQEATAVLFVDSRVAHGVRVEVDDRQVGLVPGGGHLRVGKVVHGRHRLRAVNLGGEGGRTVEEEVEVVVRPYGPDAAYVWIVPDPDDLPGSRQYVVVASSYGEVDEPLPGPEPFTAADTFFRISGELAPLLNAFPATVAVPPGAKGVIRRSLWTPRAFEEHGGRPPVSPERLRQILERARQEREEH